MNIGYAIGNAESRKDFDIRKLSGSTYGCHSIHRDYNVQNLICTDLQHLKDVEHVNIVLFQKFNLQI